MENQDVWRVMNEAWSALTAWFEPEVERACRERGLEPRIWMLLLAVLTFEPEDTTPGHLMVRGPYTSSEMYLARLNKAADLGFLDVVAPSRYRLSRKGRQTTSTLIQLAREAMVRADPLERNESIEIANMMGKLVKNHLAVNPPPSLWSITLSYKLMPEAEPPMPYIEQAFSCLAAYRDDAHLAAWQNSGLSATCLEALTMFWHGEVSSLQTLCERLKPRGYTPHVYRDAMAELLEHGYLAGSEATAWITGNGRVIRNKIEEYTDRYFYAPWSCLNNAEKQTLHQLLTKMRERLSVSAGGS